LVTLANSIETAGKKFRLNVQIGSRTAPPPV